MDLVLAVWGPFGLMAIGVMGQSSQICSGSCSFAYPVCRATPELLSLALATLGGG